MEELRYVGIPEPTGDARRVAKITGFAWEPDKIVVGAIHEVMPHPDADKLVLCKLDDGEQVHTVLTGAPNLYEFKGLGPLEKTIPCFRRHALQNSQSTHPTQRVLGAQNLGLNQLRPQIASMRRHA